MRNANGTRNHCVSNPYPSILLSMTISTAPSRLKNRLTLGIPISQLLQYHIVWILLNIKLLESIANNRTAILVFNRCQGDNQSEYCQKFLGAHKLILLQERNFNLIRQLLNEDQVSELITCMVEKQKSCLPFTYSSVVKNAISI